MTSPTRPIACESDDIIEIAPRSCRMSSNRLPPDARLGERQILGNRGIKVMAHHQHVEMLVNGVDGVGHRRIGRRRQEVVAADHPEDVRRMTTARALGMKGAEAAPAWQRWCLRQSPISFNVSEWMATCTSYLSATVRQLSMAAGVVPQSSCSLSPMAPASICSAIGFGWLMLPLAEKAEIHRKGIRARSISRM